MKKLLLLLIPLFLSAHPKPPFEYSYPNAVLIHPLFPLGVLADHYLGEVDYLRTLKSDTLGYLSVLGRVRCKRSSELWHEPRENSGTITSGELEIGIRRTYIWAHGARGEFGPYFQLTNSHGYQKYDVKYRHSEGYLSEGSQVWVTDSTNTLKGYTGVTAAGVGLHLQAKRFIMGFDIAFGIRLNPLEIPDSDKAYYLKPNFVMGYVF